MKNLHYLAYLSIFYCVCSLGTFVSFAQELPTVLWKSNPVQPGETVMIFGGNWDDSAVIKLLDVPNAPSVKPTVVTDTTITFVYPEKHPHPTLHAAVMCNGLESKPFTINAPDVWWVHGDWGQEASPGGWIRVFGTSITLEPTQAKLLLSSGNSSGSGSPFIPLEITKADRWNIEAAIPEALTHGEYHVMLQPHNDIATTQISTIIIKPHQDVWKTDRFNVVDFGAVANDGIDDTRAVQAALEKLTENGGGILFFPRGRFQIAGEIKIPPYSLIRGESQELTQLYWADTYDPPSALIRGTHSFGVEELTIFTGHHQDGIVSNMLQDKENGNITIRRVCVRLLFTQYMYQSTEESVRRAVPLHGRRLLRIGGDFVRVLHCDLHAAGGGVYEIAATNAQIAHNRMSKGQIQGWNGFRGSQMIFENNHFAGPMCVSYYALREGSHNIYWGSNIHEQTYDGNNRETITSDLRDLTYADTAESWEEQAVVLKNPQWQHKHGYDTWEGGYMQLMDGKGAGQFRKMTKIDGNRVELESPWDIKPDKDTFILIDAHRYRFLYVGNRTTDSSIGLQFYGSMIDAVVAESSFARTGGVHGYGMVYEPNWFFQYLDNTILEGNAPRGPGNEVPALDAHLAFQDRGVPGDRKYSQNRACVMRRNVLESNANLATSGMADSVLFENNTIKNSDVGIYLPAPGSNMQVRRNQFENVFEPYKFGTSSVHISPLELLAGRLGGASAFLGEAVPDAWDALQKKLEELQNVYSAKNTLDFEGESQESQTLLIQAVQELAKSWGNKPIDSKVLDVLLGAKITMPNWNQFTQLVQRAPGGQAQLLVRVPESIVLPMKVSVVFDSESAKQFPQWRFNRITIDAKPGVENGQNLRITKPDDAGAVELVSLPLIVDFDVADVRFRVKQEVSDPYAVFTLKQFMMAGPIENERRHKREAIIALPRMGVNPKGKYKSLTGDREWEVVSMGGGIDLRERFSLPAGINVAYFITAVKAARPVMVRLTFPQSMLPYVNGKPVGTTLGRGQWGYVTLNEGVNTIVLASIDEQREQRWWITAPRITQVDPLIPGDLLEVSVEQFADFAW